MHDALIRGIPDVTDPRDHAKAVGLQGAIWARQDSNLGHTDYETERQGYRQLPVTTDRRIFRAFAASK